MNKLVVKKIRKSAEALKYSDFLKQDRPCPFDNPRPEDILAENQYAYLTYALAPYHPNHLLTVPKRHVVHLIDITPEEQKAIDALQIFGWKMLKVLECGSVTFMVREGETSGRTVSHIHYHVVPEVRIGDVDHNGDARKILTPEEIRRRLADWKKIADRVRG